MLRQRLHVGRSPLALVGRVVLVAVALGLVWYGLMLVALALKVSPGTVDAISGYRSAYDLLAELSAGDISDRTRLTVGLAGLGTCALFGWLAWKELPRPRLARASVPLAEDERGATEVEPRAVERVAELTASRHPAVTSAAGRLGDDELTLRVTLRRARQVPEVMRQAQERAREALAEHGVPAAAVNVTFAGFDRSTRRELS